LRTIKHLVDEIGLNLAGVEVALKVQDTVLKIRRELASSDLSANRRTQLLKSLDESLMVLSTMLGHNVEDYAYAGGNGGNRH
jgi:hypothetical protein